VIEAPQISPTAFSQKLLQMPITESEARLALRSADFAASHETAKVAEYTSTRTRRVLYLRLGQGFPQHADVVISPDIPAHALVSIPGVAVNPKVELRFGSNMKLFPKKTNGGQQPEHYGRALQASSVEALAALCRAYSAIP